MFATKSHSAASTTNSRKGIATAWHDRTPQRQRGLSDSSPDRNGQRRSKSENRESGNGASGDRLQSIRSAWSVAEREERRRQAIRKQEQLLLLLAGDDLESQFRRAVADGEQPVFAPELDVLEN
jgi:hypothetical protein